MESPPTPTNSYPETSSEPAADLPPPPVPSVPELPEVKSEGTEERRPDPNLVPEPPKRRVRRPDCLQTKSLPPATRATRIGKIARLPQAIREQLNQRLRDGQPASKILPWLNTLPETRVVLLELFGGKPITAHNLCTWRYGGYAEWEKIHEQASRLQEMAFLAMRMANGDDQRLAQSACAAAATKVFELVGASEGTVDLNALGAVIKSLSNLRSVKAAEERAEASRQLVKYKDEQSRLARDEFEYRVRQDKERAKAEKRKESAARRRTRRGLTRREQRQIERAAGLL